jgi:hypothetical protein
MSDENALIRAQARAAQAQELLDNEMLKDAFDTLRHAYLNAWETTHANDTDARERLFLAVNVIGKVRAHLTAIVNGGKLARRELDELEGRRRLFNLR